MRATSRKNFDYDKKLMNEESLELDMAYSGVFAQEGRSPERCPRSNYTLHSDSREPIAEKKLGGFCYPLPGIPCPTLSTIRSSVGTWLVESAWPGMGLFG